MNELLENIYLEHRQGLFAFALSVVRSPELAEDAIQNAFAKLVKKTAENGSGDQQRNTVAYVFRAVRNSAIDLGRTDARKRKLSESLFKEYRSGAVCTSTPENNLLTKERDELLRHAIDGLNENDREAIVLKLFAGLTFDEAGEVAGSSPKTIATRYRRALEKLEQQLKGQI